MFSSLRSILHANRSRNVSDNNDGQQVSTCDLNVGGTILQQYQDKWAELHEIGENNAKIAGKLAECIETVCLKAKQRHESATQILHLVSPSIESSVDNCVGQLRALHLLFETAEKSLVNLEDLIENLELQNEKQRHENQLSLYKQTKLANLEEYRCSLEQKHTKKVVEHESKQQKVLQERQQAFQEAFEDDLKTYKEMGSLPKIQVSSGQSSALLEEIQLDVNDDELDQFLKQCT